MNEKPKPHDGPRRAARIMAVLSIIGLGAVAADSQCASNTIHNEVNRTIPRAASSEDLNKARKEIAIVDQAIRESIEPNNVDILNITNPLELQQAIMLVDEEQERQKQASILTNKLSMKFIKRDIVLSAVSLFLALRGLFLWRRPSDKFVNQVKPPQSTNSAS